MSINLEKLGEKLHAKIDGSIDQLTAAKTHLQNLQKETEASVQAKLNAAKEAVEAKKAQTEDAVKNLEELVDAKKTETIDMVAEWKANHDQKKLEKRAERAEKRADICVELALYAAEEAELAILEAVAARNDANGE